MEMVHMMRTLPVSLVFILTFLHIEFGLTFYYTGRSISHVDVKRLRSDLFTNYSTSVLPVLDQSKNVLVQMSLYLIMIHELDMKNQVLTASGWLQLEWKDEFLRWNPDDYGGITELILFQKEIWLPDTYVENTAYHYTELGSSHMLVVVEYTGVVHWEPGIVTDTSCHVDIGKYPFDKQTCDIRFLTWMHTNKTLEVKPKFTSISLEPMLPNGEWDVFRTHCEQYRYPSTYRLGYDHTGVKFSVTLHRKRLFYVLNTILPVMMLSCLNVLVFILPSDCGERMALAVTVLLAFTVYLGIISENVPRTSESLSILAAYLTALLAVSTASVVMAGIVLNIHYRDPNVLVPKLLIWFCAPGLRKDQTLSGATANEPNKIDLMVARPSIWAKRQLLRASRSGFTDVRENDTPSFDSDTHGKQFLGSEVDSNIAPSSNNMPLKVPTSSARSGTNTSQMGRQNPPHTAHFIDATQNSNVEDFELEHLVMNHSNLTSTGRHFQTTSFRGMRNSRNNHERNLNENRRVIKSLGGSLDELSPVTWHEIGNALDRIFFWFFFVVTNLITAIIMYLWTS